MLPFNEKKDKPIITLRSYKGFLEEFQSNIKDLHTQLVEKDWEVERPNVEYSFYDSKVNHDEEWTQKD